ncbi:MAG: NUDIX hydrolase [Geminicoccaceae bacterium]|nr:NUDIX hydrolase [Geminicoccaceae bacterium]
MVGVGVVVLQAGRILLVRRSKPPRMGEWSLPGGRQEWGETVEEAGRREVFEETGLRLDEVRVVAVVDLIERDEGGRAVIHFTLVDLVGEALPGEAVAGDDAAEAAWFDRVEIPKLGLWHETERVIALALAGGGV